LKARARREAGTTQALAGAVGLWSLGTVLTPTAAYVPTVGLAALCGARLLVGLGEGVGPPASAGLLTQLFDVRERARGVTLVFGGASTSHVCCCLPLGTFSLAAASSSASAVNLSRATVPPPQFLGAFEGKRTALGAPNTSLSRPRMSVQHCVGETVRPGAATCLRLSLSPAGGHAHAPAGMDVGNVVGLLVAPPLIATFGWPSVFYLFGLGGFIWVAAWPRVLPDGRLSVGPAALAPSATTVPQTPPPGSLAAAAPDDQRAAAAAATEEKRAEEADVPWADIVRSREVWAVTFTHFSYNWGYYTLLAWLPSYFEGALGQVRRIAPIMTSTCRRRHSPAVT